jgi:hypothetical protein
MLSKRKRTATFHDRMRVTRHLLELFHTGETECESEFIIKLIRDELNYRKIAFFYHYFDWKHVFSETGLSCHPIPTQRLINGNKANRYGNKPVGCHIDKIYVPVYWKIIRLIYIARGDIENCANTFCKLPNELIHIIIEMILS